MKRLPLRLPAWRPLLRALVLVVALGLGAGAAAQPRRVQNKPFIDERRFHYGFTVGLHDQSVNFRNNGYIDPATGAQWVVANDQQGMGFSVGVLGEWRVNRYVALRLVPSLHFGSKHLTLRDLASGERHTQDMKSTYVGLPLNVKLSAPRFNNFRPYVVTGASAYYDLTTGRNNYLQAKPLNLFFEVGLGCDLYLPFFKLIPELKFCLGMNDILQRRRTDLTDESQMVFTHSVDRGRANMVVLSLYFE